MNIFSSISSLKNLFNPESIKQTNTYLSENLVEQQIKKYEEKNLQYKRKNADSPVNLIIPVDNSLQSNSYQREIIFSSN